MTSKKCEMAEHAIPALRHQAWGAASQSCGPVSLPDLTPTDYAKAWTTTHPELS
jgi:hypothetical protein